jgi:hypothetical protein
MTYAHLVSPFGLFICQLARVRHTCACVFGQHFRCLLEQGALVQADVVAVFEDNALT